MSVLMLLFVLAVIGIAAWFLVTKLPMPSAIRTVIVIVAVIACILIAMHAFNINMPNPSVPKLN